MIKSLHINEFCRSIMILCISKLCCWLTSYSVHKLAPYSNRKITGCLSFMERMDHLRFEDTMNSFWVKLVRGLETALIELMCMKFHSESEQIWAQWNALLMARVYICILVRNKFSSHQSYIMIWKIKILLLITKPWDQRCKSGQSRFDCSLDNAN